MNTDLSITDADLIPVLVPLNQIMFISNFCAYHARIARHGQPSDLRNTIEADIAMDTPSGGLMVGCMLPRKASQARKRLRHKSDQPVKEGMAEFPLC
jgi:hypothetical protein